MFQNAPENCSGSWFSTLESCWGRHKKTTEVPWNCDETMAFPHFLKLVAASSTVSEQRRWLILSLSWFMFICLYLFIFVFLSILLSYPSISTRVYIHIYTYTVYLCTYKSRVYTTMFYIVYIFSGTQCTKTQSYLISIYRWSIILQSSELAD